MSMVAKILVVVNLFLAVAVMGAAGAYLNASQQWKARHAQEVEGRAQDVKELKANVDTANKARDEAVASKGAAERKAEGLESANRELQKSSDVLKDRLNELTASTSGIDSKLKDFQQNLDAARQQIETLTREKGQAEADRREALDRQNAAETEQKRLEAEIASLSAGLEASKASAASLAEKLEATGTELALYRSNYPPPGNINQASVKGQVLAAKADEDIFVLSIGSKDGVKMNDELTAYRGDQFVAVLVVWKVEADSCAASVKRIDGKPFKKGDVRQGDKVSSNL